VTGEVAGEYRPCFDMLSNHGRAVSSQTRLQ